MNMRNALSKPVDEEKIFGKIATVRGSVVDIEFSERLPSINSLIQTGENGSVIIEAAVHLNENQVRGIALNTTAGLFRGEKAWTTGAPLKAPVGKGLSPRPTWPITPPGWTSSEAIARVPP